MGSLLDSQKPIFIRTNCQKNTPGSKYCIEINIWQSDTYSKLPVTLGAMRGSHKIQQEYLPRPDWR
jgi:hypothetical protein